MSLLQSISLALSIIVLAKTAAAQEQVIIVDDPLKACGTGTSADLDRAQAVAIIQNALGQPPAQDTYYVVHAVAYNDTRMVVTDDNWYLYNDDWAKDPTLWRKIAFHGFVDPFHEARIFGSAKVAVVYFHANVPSVAREVIRDAIVDQYFRSTLATTQTTDLPGFNRLRVRLESAYENDHPARKLAREKRGSAVSAGLDAEVEYVAWLSAAEYVDALVDGNKTITDAVTIVDAVTDQPLSPLKSGTMVNPIFRNLDTLFYRVTVTRKSPSNVMNLKAAAGLPFAGQASAKRVTVPVARSGLCAGRLLAVKHEPSDVTVSGLLKAGDDEKELGKQLYDNEKRHWWDVSFALPLKSRSDLTVDIEGGQIAAKKVEKADLFVVANLGWPRDTKRPAVVWPTFIYGMPITGKPLKHHLLGATFGLNYVELFVGYRFDQKEQITPPSGNAHEAVPTVTVAPPPGRDRWDDTFVWGVNIPVSAVVKLLSKDDK